MKIQVGPVHLVQCADADYLDNDDVVANHSEDADDDDYDQSEGADTDAGAGAGAGADANTDADDYHSEV